MGVQMPYQSYQSAWSRPYAPQGAYAGYQQAQVPTYANGYQHTGRVMVDGPTEAMNRFLMMYPANQLTPGFISDELFDVNGRQFHVLSIEADGRRNLETFDYAPHRDEAKVIVDGVEFESREEFDTMAAKVRAILGVHDGVPTSVPAGGYAAGQPAAQPAGQPVRVDDAGQNQNPQVPDRGRPSGDAGPAV